MTVTPTDLDWSAIRAQAGAFITTEYASLDRNGAPITWPVTPYLGTNSITLDVATGLSYPLKAQRARRNPKISLGFSEPRGSGLDHPATFVAQGLAAVRDADLRANSARYLAESTRRFPEAFAAIPTPALRRMAFYWARIWVEMTPTRVLWWDDGDLDREPRIWTAPASMTAAPSDPAPTGPGAGSWNTDRPVPWQKRVRGALTRLGMPVLTTVTPDGWPLPLRMREAETTVTGFRLWPPAGVDLRAGAACLTFHTHGATFDSQDNVTLVGSCRETGSDSGTIEFDADRALNDFILPKNPLRRTLYLLAAGRRLGGRLASEAARRGQTVPRFEDLGFRS